MDNLYRVINDSTDTFYVLAPDEETARTKFETWISESSEAPSLMESGTTVVRVYLLGSAMRTAALVQPWANLIL